MKNSHFAIMALLSALLIFGGCETSKTTEKDGLLTDETKTEIEVNTTVGYVIAESQEMGERVEVPGLYDFNGDGKPESCYLVEPITYDDEERLMECEGDCHCLIEFSDASISPIEVENCIGGMPDILGDLDGNGTVEIGIWPAWWTSCWHAYYVFTFMNGKWTYFIEPFSVHCNLIEEMEESGEPIIEAVKGSSNSFMIRYSDFDVDGDEGIQTKTKIVTKLI